jgi:hypothetical protein
VKCDCAPCTDARNFLVKVDKLKAEREGRKITNPLSWILLVPDYLRGEDFEHLFNGAEADAETEPSQPESATPAGERACPYGDACSGSASDTVFLESPDSEEEVCRACFRQDAWSKGWSAEQIEAAIAKAEGHEGAEAEEESLEEEDAFEDTGTSPPGQPYSPVTPAQTDELEEESAFDEFDDLPDGLTPAFNEPDEPSTYDRFYDCGPDGDFTPSEDELERGIVDYYDHWVDQWFDEHPECADGSCHEELRAEWGRHYNEWEYTGICRSPREQREAERQEHEASARAIAEDLVLDCSGENNVLAITAPPTDEEWEELLHVNNLEHFNEYERATVRAAIPAAIEKRLAEDAEDAERAAAIEKLIAETSAEADLFAPNTRVMSVRQLLEHPELLDPPKKISNWLGRRGRVVLFWGREKSGKSTITTHDAAHATTNGHTVLWVSFEESRATMAQRFADVQHLNPDLIFLPESQVRTWDDLEATVREHDPDMVVIDSLTSAIGVLEGKIPDQSQPASWGKIVLKLQRLALDDQKRDERAVVVLGHSKKDRSDYAGSHAIGSSVDMLVMNREDKSGGRTLIYRGRWDEESVGTMYNEETGEIKETTARSRWFDSEAKVIKTLQEHGSMSRTKLRDIVKMRHARLIAVVNSLKDRGILREPKRGVLALTDAADEFESLDDEFSLGDLTKEQTDHD